MIRSLGRVLVWFCSMCVVLAQIDTGTFVGTVTDPSGAVTAGALVTIRRVETNETSVSRTNDSGDFRVERMPVGNYDITAMLSGFKTEERKGIKLDVGRVLRIDFRLAVGDTAERVEVNAAPPLLTSEKAEFGQVIDNRKLEGLPINNRDFTQLAVLAPGVTPRRGSVNGDFGQFNVRGMRAADNMVHIDGTMFSHGNGVTWFRPSIDAFQEFEVKTGLYGAEYGIKPGAQVNAVIKSGTNQLHGNAFWFHRNDNLDARNFFAARKQEFKRNQFGATLGGPIYIPKVFSGTDRAWFFVSYQKESIRQFVPLTGVVPTAAERAGQFAAPIRDPFTQQPIPNNTIPASLLNGVSQKLLQWWPLPNTADRPNYTSPNTTLASDTPQFITRMDVKTSEVSKWAGSFMWDRSPAVSLNAISAFSSQQPLTGRLASISNTRTLSNSVVNQASIHNVFRTQPLGPSNPKPDAARDLGIPVLVQRTGSRNGIPTTNVQGFLSLGDTCCTGHFAFGNWQIKESLLIAKGNHSVKTGYEFRQYYIHPLEDKRPIFNFVNRYSGNSFADFLMGVPASTEGPGQESVYNLRHKGHYFYIQDDWKVHQKLTINIGLRYEYRLPWRDKRGTSTNINPLTAEFRPALLPADRQPNADKLIYEPNAELFGWRKTAFLPRIGLAYRLGQSTVVRTGYGMYSNEVLHSVGLRLGLNPKPGTEIRIFNAPIDRPTISLSDPFPQALAASATPTRFGVESPMPLSVSHSWGLSIQRAITPDLVAEVGYQGMHAVHQDGVVSFNDAAPGTGNRQLRRPFPNLQRIEYLNGDGDASYHGLEAKLEKRPGRDGLYYLAAFTFSKALDTVGNRLAVAGTEAFRSRNIGPANSFSEAHVGRRLVLTSGYELPFGPGRSWLQQGAASHLLGGWSIQGIASFQDGPWFTVLLPGDAIDTGSVNSQRPDVVRNPNLDASSRSRIRWFDTAAFVRPTELRYGNAGRNIVRGPGLINVDLSVHRRFQIAERHRIEFRFEMFNSANHANFTLPGNSFGTGNFGVIGGALEPRDLQFGLKYFF
ncbi:MAG: TonB-dependent receptor domain-containing protein [Bryobacteraceae bacterium]